MNEKRFSDDEQIAALLGEAEPRPPIPPDFEHAAYGELEQVWRSVVRRRRRVRLGFALAASLLVVAAVGWLGGPWLPEAPAPGLVASVARSTGTVLAGSDTGLAAIAPGQPLYATQRLVTSGDARAALDWTGGVSVRLDRRSAVVLLSDRRLRLLRGQVYVDSPPGQTSAPEIATPLGSVRHVGTQFIVSLQRQRLDIRVREGAVLLDDGDNRTTVDSGEALQVAADGRRVSRPIQRYGAEWTWVETIGVVPAAGHASLRAFVDWVARETGRTITVASDDIGRRLAALPMPTGVRTTAPLDALADALTVSGLTYREEAGTIVIDTARP
ncbi:MAG: FecR domain-containing protein [Pseudomonadota bacterium]